MDGILFSAYGWLEGENLLRQEAMTTIGRLPEFEVHHLPHYRDCFGDKASTLR